jgi:hypothetical protein
VLRHARASRVTVAVSEADGGYQLEVTDDGTGSPPGHDTGGRGLLGMHERAELLGGTLSAGPLESGGFRVTARIPQSAGRTAADRATAGRAGRPAASQPPVAQPSVAQPPVAQPPVAQPPVAQPPVTHPPSSHSEEVS